MASISYAPFQWPPHGEICCTVPQAISWLSAIAEMALGGDDDARRALGEAAQHYIAATRQGGVPR